MREGAGAATLAAALLLELSSQEIVLCLLLLSSKIRSLRISNIEYYIFNIRLLLISIHCILSNGINPESDGWGDRKI